MPGFKRSRELSRSVSTRKRLSNCCASGSETCGAIEVTLPLKTSPGYAAVLSITGWPTRTFSACMKQWPMGRKRLGKLKTRLKGEQATAVFTQGDAVEGVL